MRSTAPPGALDEVVKAYGAAGDAMAEGDLDRARELLEWAKSTSPRTATLREALGVLHYTAGRFAEAHSELLAYRRLSGHHDQNHLLADCARAAGRHEKVHEYVEQMLAENVALDRVAEGLIVLASDRADQGDVEGALDTLQQHADLDPERVQDWHPRVWYVAADLCERLGRTDAARDYFEAIAAVDDEFGDVQERLAALS